MSSILAQLEAYNLEFADCRAQCYDNANTMAGHISRVNQRLLAENELALFVNCDNHSLDLVAKRSAEGNTIIKTGVCSGEESRSHGSTRNFEVLTVAESIRN